ncbi:hypothetical protein ABMA27_007871 [Loxostege sticticalis]|uniref:MADF domain-containing protein n=1 Tax=Loxostege sticticalis TaxID=481309 RepID=A0ABR3HD58_LOXSC
MKMNDQRINIRFVQEVERHPCLYNYTLPEYSRKDVTQRAWNAVGKIFNLSESESKEKWKNLRAVFVRHMKPSSKNKKPYYLADAMKFTIPYIKVLNGNTTGDFPQEAVEVVMEQEDNEEAEEYQYLSPQASSTYINIAPSPMSSYSPRPTDETTNSPPKNHRKRNPSAVDESILNYFKTKAAKLQNQTEDRDDPKRMFLLSLLPDLKAMSDSQTRTFKRRVLALVDEILDPVALPPQRATPAGTVSKIES